jgi:beta-phosphoglucomutase
MKTKIKSILFDLDGVLVDACHWHYEALNRALDSVSGTKIDYDDHIENFNGLPTSKKLEMLIARGSVYEYQVDQIWKLKQKNTIEVINDLAEIDPGKILLHEHLKISNISRACVTNSIRETAELMLINTGQIDMMSFIISNEDVRNNKPHPEPYISAMVRLGTLPAQTLIIEDSDKGMESALATGSHVLRVQNAKDVTWERISEIIRSIE